MTLLGCVALSDCVTSKFVAGDTATMSARSGARTIAVQSSPFEADRPISKRAIIVDWSDELCETEKCPNRSTGHTVRGSCNCCSTTGNSLPARELIRIETD